MLRPIIYAGIAAGLFSITLSWGVASMGELMALAAEVVALGLTLPLLAKGRLRASIWLFGIAILLGSTVIVYSYGTLRVLAVMGFGFAVMLAAMFLSRRELVAMILLAWIAVAGLAYAEVTREIPIEVRPVTWRYAVLLNLGVLFVGLVAGYARAVTAAAERKQQAALGERERAEERLRLSMEATRQAWFDLDLDTGRVATSEHFLRLMGVQSGAGSEPMTRDSWIAAIHREDRPDVLQRFDRCLRLGETEQMDYRLMGMDGSFRWIRSTAKVVQRDENGRPLRMTGTHADITDQIATTLALAASERSYRALVEMSPIGVIVLRAGAVRYANPAAVTMLGAVEPEELLGADMRQLLPSESLSRLEEICAIATSRGGVATDSVEQTLQRVTGQRFDASIRCTAVVFEGLPSLQFSFADISAQKLAEENRLRSRQLEALGTLAGGIAHDFNNILLAIRGNAELVAGEPGLSAAGAEQMKEVLMAGQRASELVRRITTFARPKEQRHDRVHLPDVLHEVLRLLRPTIPAGISLHVRAPDHVPPILADSAQVHETIVNLTANAVYAIGGSRVGQVSFTVDQVDLNGEAAGAAEVSAGRYTRLTVSDTGPGMSPETQQRIFDAFYTTKPVGEGSGLGLSMVYGTMRGHRGSISVESRPGEGATFRLLFPSVDATAIDAPHAPPVSAPALSSLRVMYVDDEPQLVRLAQRTLTPLGHIMAAFTDPREALAAFRASPMSFDVLVTDLSMPHMSGLDLAKAVRTVRADIPVVMVTGYADDTDEAAALAAGVSRLAIKATDAHQLSRLLAEVAAHT